jgi:hypothetical protein
VTTKGTSHVAQLRLFWLLWRSGPRNPLTTDQKIACLDLFDARHPNVPPKHKELWLVEEAREDIAMAVLRLAKVNVLCWIPSLFTFAHGHIRLWFLLKAIQGEDKADHR